MSVFTAKIKLEDDKKDFNFGDIIRGKVLLKVTEKIDLKVLEVDLKWMTRGKGTVDSKVVLNKAICLEIDTSLEEDIHIYDFEIEIPIDDRLPESYSGDVISINWSIALNVDIKNNSLTKIFQKENFDKIIKIKRKNEEKIIDQCIEGLSLINSSNISLVIGLLIGAPASIGILIFLINSREMEVLELLMTLLIFSVFEFISFLAIKYSFELKKAYIQKKKINKINLEYTDKFTDNLEFKINLSALKTINLKEITWKLNVKEIAVSGSGTNRTTHTREIYIKEKRKSINKVINSSENESSIVNFNFWKKIPKTFSGEKNFIKWTLELKLNGFELETYELIVV